MEIDDPADPRLVDYKHLTDASARRALEGAHGEGIFVVEGVLALRQLLRSRYHVRSILSTPARAHAVSDELAMASTEHGSIPHLVAQREIVKDITGFDVHRGVLAAADRMHPDRLEDVLEGCTRVVVADGMNDHENLGSVFRNAAALGLGAVLLDDSAADPLYRRSIRVSSGWTMRVPYARLGPSEGIPAVLRAHGLRSVALTPARDAVRVDEAASAGLLDDPVAFVVGPEGPGLSADVLEGCDHRVCIPMTGEVDSLNVATSLAVVAAFAASRRGWSD